MQRTYARLLWLWYGFSGLSIAPNCFVETISRTEERKVALLMLLFQYHDVVRAKIREGCVSTVSRPGIQALTTTTSRGMRSEQH